VRKIPLAEDTRIRLRRFFTWALAVTFVVAVLGVVYTATVVDEPEEPFTEFYVLGDDGNASGYPVNLTSGETGTINLGLVNHEQRPMTYSVFLVLDDEPVTERLVVIEAGERWEDELEFTATDPGESRMDILLYKGENPDLTDAPYRNLQLPIEVRQ